MLSLQIKAIIAEHEGDLEAAETHAAAQGVEVDDGGNVIPETPSKRGKGKGKRQIADLEALQKSANTSQNLVSMLQAQLPLPEPINERTAFAAYLKATLMNLQERDFRKVRARFNKELAPFISVESSSDEEEMASIRSNSSSSQVRSGSRQSQPSSISATSSLSDAGQTNQNTYRLLTPGQSSQWQPQPQEFTQQYMQQPYQQRQQQHQQWNMTPRSCPGPSSGSTPAVTQGYAHSNVSQVLHSAENTLQGDDSVNSA